MSASRSDPTPYGLKVNDTNVIALLLNGQLDMISRILPADAADLQDAEQAEVHRLHRQLPGRRRSSPTRSCKLKSFKDYIEEGKSFEDAIKAALAPMEGKTLVGAPELSDRPFEEHRRASSRAPSGSCRCWTTPSRWCSPRPAAIDFVNPEGAPIVYTLDAGGLDRSGRHRRPLSSTAPAASIRRSSRWSRIVGIGGQRRFRQRQPEHRAALPVGRLADIDAVEKDPSLYDLQAPYLNSVAGTSLDGKGVESTVKILIRSRPSTTTRPTTKTQASIALLQERLDRDHQGLRGARHHSDGRVTPDDVIWGGADLAPDGRLPDQDGRL